LDDDIMGQCSSDDDSGFDGYYAWLVTPGTHTVRDRDIVNDCKEQRTVMHDEQGTGMERVWMKFVWQDISRLSAVQVAFLTQLLTHSIVNETNRYALQELF
jgi:hypothetical protein